MTHRVALVLSGCGVYDGVEITEAVALMIALDQANIAYDCYAPDRMQMHVIDHSTGEVTGEMRHILVEAARIARGKIFALPTLNAAKYDAIVFPGGFGAAKNLTTFANDGEGAVLFEDVAKAVLPFIAANKPIVAVCASPLVQALAAREAGLKRIALTFGNNEHPALVAAIEAWGQKHQVTPIDQACVDSQYPFISAPAYTYGEATAAEIFASCQAAITALSQFLK
jgi:enhancing lycopene biosynthesis protein 2